MSYRYFAFLDLLGYKELIKNDLSNGQEQLKHKLTDSFNGLAQINEADISLKAISDSIFVSLNNEALGFIYFASILQQLQISFLKNGLLLRGGVAYERHFENSKVTYSMVLVEAYKLESEKAVFPRILIHPAIIEKLKNEGKFDEVIASKLIVKHADDYQIHFLSDDNWEEVSGYAKKIAEDHINLIKKSPNVYSKHWYLQEYVRFFKPKSARFKSNLPTWGS